MERETSSGLSTRQTWRALEGVTALFACQCSRREGCEVMFRESVRSEEVLQSLPFVLEGIY